MQEFTSLVINPGSTSTKIAVFENEKLLFEETIRHSAQELAPFGDILDQLGFRSAMVFKALEEKEVKLSDLDFIMARGGILRPLASGTYIIDDRMKEDLKHATIRHASNIAAFIADDVAKKAGGIPAFIADPVVVDELADVARISGHPDFVRGSTFHALNQKAIARRYADEHGAGYESLNLIVCHMGGGISVGVHHKGRVIDVNQALDGEGPFSPERSGSLPSGDLVRAAFSGKYTRDEMVKMIIGKGGVMAYLGTSDMREVTQMDKNGDKKVQLILDAMAYQIAKTIGAMATVLKGEIDAIILTGGIAYNPSVMDRLVPRITFLAPVAAYPGEDELLALAQAGLRVMNKREKALEY